MESILFFIIFSGIWAFADAIFSPIFSSLLGISEGYSECIVGIVLGAIAGLFFGPIIAISLEQKASSWIATFCLIVSSFMASSF